MTLFIFLLLALASLTGTVDAQGSPASTVGQVEEDTNAATREPVLKDGYSMLRTGSTPEETVATKELSSVTAVTMTEGAPATSARSSTTTERTSASPPLSDSDKQAADEDHEKIFGYDYYFLRKWGLVAAAILFILGILILTCGKNGKSSRCRGKKRARNYDVTQA